MQKIVLCLGFLLISLPVMARLDENENECIRRYGQPVTASARKSTEKTFERNYKLGDFFIKFSFINGVAVEARYSLNLSIQRPKLLDAEIEAILEAERGTGTWKPVSQSMTQYLVQTSGRNWENTNGAKATYDGRKTISLTSGAADTQKAALQAEKEREASKNIPKF